MRTNLQDLIPGSPTAHILYIEIMRIITESISADELTEMARAGFGDMVKAVVDVERRTLALGAELHADEEAALLESGSEQDHLWGINLYPEDRGSPEFIEFDSMINIRPSRGNRSRGVDDEAVRERIVTIVTELITS
ncbi:DUF5674 family protein [Gemmatimonadota bacterium]